MKTEKDDWDDIDERPLAPSAAEVDDLTVQLTFVLLIMAIKALFLS